LVRVKVPEVRAHVLKNKKNLKQQRDVGGVYIDPYFSKPGDLRIYQALKTKEVALRKQNTPCRWVGPLALQQRINGAWVPVQVPPHPQLELLLRAAEGRTRAVSRITLHPRQPLAVGVQPHSLARQLQQQLQQQQALLRVKGGLEATGEERRSGGAKALPEADAPRSHPTCPRL
jgi:hypothetical protein